jgi:hypothetical protein
MPRGYKHTEKTKKKLREQKLGKKLAPEHREKVIKTLASFRDQKGNKNPYWKGGKSLKMDGYVLIRLPDHPQAMSNGYIFEHRLVMENKLGRQLGKYEHVHHLNTIKDDNRPENLELVNGSTHNLITRLEKRVKELEKEVTLLKGV